MERDPGEAGQETIGLNFLFFLFLVTFGQTSQSQKTKVQTHGEGPRRGWTGDIGLNFLFFWFLVTFGQTSQNRKNKKFRPIERDLGEAGQET